MKKILELYCTFFRIGILTFGGGMAMLPMLKRETDVELAYDEVVRVEE